MHKGPLDIIAACCVLLTTASCASDDFWSPKPVESHGEVGSVGIAVISVAPWDEYVDAMQPTFKLSEKDALSAVVPTTQTLTEKVIDSLAAQLKVAPPTSGIKVPGEERSRESGDAQGIEIPANPGSSRSAVDLPGTALSTKIDVDPMTRHRSATALFQEVNVLNRHIKDAALRRGYRPYVVRVQATVIPTSLGRPYDVFSTFSLFNGTLGDEPAEAEERTKWEHALENSKSARIPYVIPLLVTDNLESSLQSRTQDQIRQLGFALDLLVSGFGASASASSYQEALKAVFGRQTNSLLTVARLSDNTVRFRLGAPFQTQQERAMIPQTHYITFVVLIDEKMVECYEKCGAFANAANLLTKSSFVDTRTGKELQLPTSKRRQQQISDVFLQRVPKWKNDESGAKEANERATTCEAIRMERAKHAGVLRGFAFGGLEGRFREYLWNNVDSEANWFALWIDLIDVERFSAFATASFDLPQTKAENLPIARAAILLDDKKSFSRLDLAGGSRLRADRIEAALVLPCYRSVRIPAIGIAVKDSGRRLALTFPSLAIMGLPKSATDGALLEVKMLHSRWKTRPATEHAEERTFEVVYRKSGSSSKPKHRFSLKTTTKYVVAKGGKGSLRVFVEFPKSKAGMQLISEMKLQVTGADLATIKNQSDAEIPAATAAIEGQVVTIKKSTTLVLKLENLSQKQAVKLEGKEDSDRTSKIIEIEITNPPKAQ